MYVRLNMLVVLLGAVVKIPGSESWGSRQQAPLKQACPQKSEGRAGGHKRVGERRGGMKE